MALRENRRLTWSWQTRSARHMTTPQNLIHIKFSVFLKTNDVVRAFPFLARFKRVKQKYVGTYN
jgi:hypothetical protein